MDALKDLSDDWQPARVLHTDADDRAGATQRVERYAFYYFAQDRRAIKKLHKKLKDLRDYYKAELEVIKFQPHDLQGHLLTRAQDALRRELEPALLGGALHGDVVPVYAVARWCDLAVQYGEVWLRCEDHLWVAHNLTLAYLDWGEECVCSCRQEDAVRRWWDAVKHWSLLFDLDHPHVVQHWRRWVPDESRQALAVMGDDALASVVKDVRQRVFGLLGMPPWSAFALEEEREARWLYDCALNLFRISPGDYPLLASAPITSVQTGKKPLGDVWYLIELLMFMAEQPDSRLDLLMEWEDWEQERLQHGWHLFLHAEYILNHLKRRHFTGLLPAPPDRRTVRLGRKLTVFLGKSFNSEELQTLCHALQIDHENLHRETKGSLCRSRVRYCQAHSKVEELARQVIKDRPLVEGIGDLETLMVTTSAIMSSPHALQRKGEHPMSTSTPSPAFNAHALVVGVGKYERLSRLTRTANDAQDMYDLLIDPDRCGYQGVTLLLEEQATRPAVMQEIEALARLPTDATALVFFSGHGTRIEDGQAARSYLCTYETTVDNLDGTAISGEEFAAALRRIPAQKTIVFFDVCHAGGVGQPRAVTLAPTARTGLAESYYQELAKGSGRAIIASCREDEASWELADMRNGVFTHYLLHALKGEACIRDDGLIRIYDIADYVQRAVPQRISQHPVFHGVAIDQNFPVARCTNGGIKRLAEKILKPRYSQVDSRRLRTVMSDSMSNDDFIVLCFALNVKPDNLPGQNQGLPVRLIFLIEYHEHRGIYEKLVEEFIKMRPNLEGELFTDAQ